MKISAELILASKNAATNDILYTFVLTYPRPILPHILTHRTFSRNTSSDRAIPSRKLRQIIKDEPYIPLYIGQNCKGMVAGPELRGWKREAALGVIKAFRYPVLLQSWLLEKLGVHKEIANRYCDPYIWVRQVVTATDWKNFVALRTHKDAEPHIRHLAREVGWYIKVVEGNFDYVNRYPDESFVNQQILQPLSWHIPFLGPDDSNLTLDQKLKVSAARAARTSYTVTHSNVSEWESDFRLATKLIDSKHLSPLEHQAQAVSDFRYHGNFKSFVQLRKTIPQEDGGDRAALQEVTQ